jgi:hypothetical protein
MIAILRISDGVTGVLVIVAAADQGRVDGPSPLAGPYVWRNGRLDYTSGQGKKRGVSEGVLWEEVRIRPV